ncbi:MAG: universal stress protein [Alphaproteobacteria bacterium]|nr:universal stress protein [Alphaproteobacteria bacterium]MDE1986397.1 universal stress protein [Alphaproteobacteria bacterium]MDE2266302.1 universal stress protein [Alphaproteobacteria bacterium]MDE2498684.1 universal stress protein [Alphaproteobacteria bacterium]
MPFVKILVPVAGAGRDRFALQTAFAAARPFNAHVVALFVHADPRESVPYGELPFSPGIVQDLIDTAADLEKAASKAARSTLATLAAESGIRIISAPQRSDAVTVSYQEIAGHLARALDREARLCDLVVFPPIRETDDPEIQDGFIRTLTKLERPVLLSSEKPPEQIGRRVAVGWDGGIACAHALTAALPFLAQAQDIEILSIQDTSNHHGCGVDDVAAYLALHGLTCTRRIFTRNGDNVAELLLESAANGGFDMLVAGGYGHSRLMESIFGGVTEHIVSHPKIPVFMMH